MARGLCFGADLIISVNTLGNRGGSSVLSERESICQVFGPVYISMPALPTVNTGALRASGRCRPNTRATESKEQGSSPGRCLDRDSGTELTGRDGIRSGQ